MANWEISAFAEKHTTAEFDMIHPHDVVEKYAPDAATGKLGKGGEGDDDEEVDFSRGRVHHGRGGEAQQER